MSCTITYKGKKYSEEQFKEYFINNKNEFVTSISKNKDVIDSFKTKMEAIDGVFKDSPKLASIGTKTQYMQYLSTIFPDSKVKDIVYHFSNVKINKPDKEKFSLSANINRRKGFFGINKNINPGNNFANVEGTIPHAMLFNMKNPDFGDFSIIPPIVAKDKTKDSAIIKQRGDINYYTVFEPEQIHILGSKEDIEGFKNYVNNQSKFLTQENNNSVQNTYTNHLTYSQALEKARQLLPDFKEKDLKFVTEKMMDGDKLGFYQSGVVNVLSKNTLTTEEYILRHELFHKIFTEYLTKNEQKSLYNNFSKEFGEGLSLFEFEEQLALKFQSWKNKEIEVKSSVLKTLFNKILRFFGLIQANTKNLNELFKQIERGQLSVKKQEVTSTIKNLDKIINLYGSAKNFKELKEEMDSKINELQTVGAVNKRTYVYLDGIHSLFKKNKETPVYNDLLKQLKLENEITLIVPNILGKYVDYNYLINKAIAANENLSKESIKSIIDNYSEKRALQVTELLKNPALESVNEYLQKNYINLTSKKFVEVNENIFLNNHVNKREIIAILKKMFKEKYTFYKKELNLLLKDIDLMKNAISSSTNEEQLRNLNLQLESLEEQRRKLNTPLRKYMFITDNTNEGFTYLYESSYPKITEEDLLEARLYDINEFDEEIDGDPDTKSKEFAFDAETKNMKTSIASSAKIILSNIIDKEKINKEGTQGVKLPFGYSYVLAVKLMEGLDPSLSDFNKQIDKKFEALDGTSSMKAVANTIKTIYNESLRTNIKVGDKTYLLPINAKFLDDKTFIYSTANRDLSEVKTKDDVLKINKEDQNNGTIFIFKKRKNKEGHLEDTMTFTYRLLKEIEEQQYVFGITDSKTFPQHFDTGTKGMILMNRLYYKMISNITFVELMQNLLSQKEKNRYIGLTSVNKDGSVTSTYRAGMQRDTNADMVKKVERALINNLNSKENIVKLRGSFFVHNNNFYKYFGAKTLGYDVQFKALKHFLEFIGYNKEELDKISINNFDDTKDKLKIRELYLDVYHFLYDNTSKNRLQSIVQFNSKVDEKIEKKRQYTEEEIEKLKEDESLTAIDIEERIKEGVSYFAEPELEDILEDNGSLLQKLAKFLSSNANNESQTMSVDAAGKKKNAHTVSSVAVDTLKRLEEGNLKLIEIENQSQYKYLYTPTYKHNIFNPVNPQKFNVIEKQIEDDGYKIKYGYGSNETKSFYTKETLKEFYTRTFNLAFLKVAEDSANKKLQYIQYLPIISNRPFAAGAKINMLNPIEIKKGLMAYVNQFISRPDLKGIEGYNKYSTVNFSIFEDALKSMDINKFSIDENTSEETKNQLVQQMYNRLHLRAIEVTKNILDNNVVLDTDLKKIATKLESYVDKSVYNFKKEDYKSSEKIRESVSSVKERVRKDIASGKLSIKEEELSKMNETDLMELGYFRGQILDIEKLLPLVSVFVLNTYVNSYFLDQITMGESSFFKNSTARIKRRQGVFAPGLKPIVHSKLGIDEHFNVMVVSDTVVDKLGEVNSIESFFKSLNISQELLDKLLKKFSKDGFNPADGQGLMLPERRDQIKQSIGLSYGLGNILKPAHYEVDEFGIPRMMKYSSIVLTDELVKEFPELGNVRQKMRENNAGEMIFESAFKVGAPKNRVNATELLTNPSYKIPEESIVKLNNHNYKLQLNPEHDIEDSKVAKPTQLSYFLSILNKNLPQAKQVYSAYSKITNLKLDAFTKILNVDEENKVDNKSFIDLLESSLEGGTSEREQQILSELSHYERDSSTRRSVFNKKSLAWNHPAITDKMFTQLISLTNNRVIKSDFRGSKLVLQSSWGTDNRYGEQKKLKYSRDKNGKLYAEVVVPKGLLSKELEDKIENAIKNKEELPQLFLQADLLGFRIPSSEIHSGVALKVVSFYESSDEGSNNVIIAPEQLVPLHGSDFDVDALYVIKRNTFAKYPKLNDNEDSFLESLGFIPGQYIGYHIENDLLHISNVDEKGIVDTSIFEQKVEAAKTYYEDLYKDKEDIFNKVEKYLNNVLNDYYQNIITETFLQVMQNPENEDRMLAPIETETLKAIIKEQITKPFPNADISSGIDESFISDQQRVHSSSMNGRDGTGIAANDVKANAYMMNASKTSEDGVPTLKYTEEEGRTVNKYKFYFTNPQGYEKIQNLVEIFEMKDSILNAAIDNVKEQLLPQLNINGDTMPIFMTMLGLGMDVPTIVQIMTQPSVRMVSNIAGKINKKDTDISSSKGISYSLALIKSKIKELGKNSPQITELLSNIEQAGLYEDKSEFLVINDEDLKKGLSQINVSKTALQNIQDIKDINILISQYKILINLNKVYALSRHITNMSRFLSIIRDLPVFYDEYQSKVELLQQIFEKDDEGNYTTKESFPFEIDNFFEVNPHIKSSVDVLLKINDIAKNNFFKYSEALTKVENNKIISSVILDVNENKNKLLLRNEYLKSVFNSFYDFSEQEDYISVTKDNKVSSLKRQEAFTQHFNNKIFLLSLIDKNNSFLSKLNIINSSQYYKNIYYLDFNNSSKLDIVEILDIIDSFKSLNKYNITEISSEEYTKNKTNPNYKVLIGNFYKIEENENPTEYSDLQKDFVKYAALNYGLGLGKNNYSAFLPTDIYRDLYYKYENFLKDNLLTSVVEENLENFEVDFMLNHGDKLMDLKQTIINTTPGYENNIFYDIIIENSLPTSRKYIKWGTSIYIKVADKSEEAGKVYYQFLGKVNKSKFYTSQIRDDKFQQYSLVDKFNPFIFTLKLQSLPKSGEVINVINKTLSKISDDSIIRITDLKDNVRKYGQYYKIKRISKDNYTFEITTEEDVKKLNTFIDTSENVIEDTYSPFTLNKKQFYENRILERESIPFSLNENLKIEDVHNFFYENANPIQKGIIDMLPKRYSDYVVSFTNSSLLDKTDKYKDSSLLGRIDLTNKKIQLKTTSSVFNDKNTYDLTWTYIHELVHIDTFNVLNADESLLTEKQLAGKRKLQELRKKIQYFAKQDNKKFNENPFVSLDEFVAQAFTDYKFQQYLSTKKVEKKSAWTKFTEKISQLLGLSDDSLLTDIISTVLEITDDNIPSVTFEAPVVLYRKTYVNNQTKEDGDEVFDSLKNQSKTWISKPEYYESTIDPVLKNVRVTKRLELIAYGKELKKSYIQSQADFFFETEKNKVDEDGKRYIPRFAKKISKEEFIKLSTKRLEDSQIKGKIIDAYIELVLGPEENKEKLKKEIINLERRASSDVIYLKTYIMNNLKSIVKFKLRSNLFDEKIDNELRDIFSFQLTTGSKALETTGTADILVKHADGTFSLHDTKTGVFDLENDNIVNLMHNGSKSADLNIPNNGRNRAKLQIVLYALMFKLNNPKMKFRYLSVLHLPNKHAIDDITVHLDSVEVKQYLDLIKSFLQTDIDLQKSTGWLAEDSTKTLYEKLLEEFKNNGADEKYLDKLFDYREYNTGYNLETPLKKDNFYEPFIKAQNQIDALLEEQKMISLTNLDDPYFKNASFDEKSQNGQFRAYQKRRMNKITEEILKLKSNNYDFRTAKDIGMGRLWIGTSSDINNPLFMVWNKLKMEREDIFRNRVNDANIKFDIKFDKFFKKYSDKLSAKIGLRGEGMREMFGHLVKEEEINGRKEERLILPKDKEWTDGTLDENEKELLTFMNDYFRSYFSQDSYLNQVATQKFTNGFVSALTHLDLYNQKKSQADKFFYYDGWFPKVLMSPDEVRDRVIENSGVIESIPKIIKNHWRRELSNFYEKDFMETEETSSIPIRGLGNDKVITRKNYTLDFEDMFKSFVENMEHKIAYDDVYHFGRSLTLFLNDEYSELLGKHYRYNSDNNKTELAFENTIKFIKDRMRNELKGTTYKKLQYLNQGKPITIPGTKKQLDADKAILYGTKWATGLAMHLKPIGAIGNTIHGKILLRREGLKGDLGEKFLGIDKRGIDFTSKDLIRAEKEVAVMWKDEIFGQSAKNKQLLFAHEFGYLPDEYGFINNRKGSKAEKRKLLSSRNLYFMHNIGENYLAYLTMSAQLMHMTMKVGDKDVSVYDLYKVMEYDENFNLVEEGKGGTNKFKLVWIGPKRYIKEGNEVIEANGLTDREIKKLKRFYAKMQGDYRKDEVIKLRMYVATKAVIVLKQFFTRIILNGISSKFSEPDLGYYKETGETFEYEHEDGSLTKEELLIWYQRETEGKWRTLGKALYYILTSATHFNGSHFSNYWANLSDDQKLNIMDALVTMGQFVLFTFIGSLIFGGADDDDSLKKAWRTYLIDNPSQQYNIFDLLRTSKTVATPVVVSKAFDATFGLSQLALASINYTIGNEDAAFNERGNLKGLIQTMKSIPYMSSFVDFYDKASKIDNEEWFAQDASFWSINENVYR